MMESKTIERWTAVSVWGYRDSPFTWDNLQHYYHVNGENDTTFLMLPPAIEKETTMISFQMYGTDHIPKQNCISSNNIFFREHNECHCDIKDT